MKIVDCKWELENLGCRVAEVAVSSLDDFEASAICQIEKDYNYIVIKAESKDLSLYKKLGDLGYRFVETQISLQVSIQRFCITDNSILQCQMPFFQFKYIEDENVMRKALERMTNDMYSTDRISLDPLFGSDFGLRRYRNWSYTEFLKGSPCYQMMYRNECAGMAVLRLSGNKVEGLLAGLYTDFQDAGLGLMIPTLPLLFKGTDYKVYSTNVSSNNLPIIQAHLFHNYKVTKFRYVFTKHI